MDVTYETGDKSKFGEPVLGMVLGPVFGMAMGTTQGAEVRSRVSRYGKSEGYCVGEII